MTDRVQFSPRQARFTGGKIGLQGDTIRLYCQKMTPRFRQDIIKADQVNGQLLFFASRDVIGTVRVEGVYENVGGLDANTLVTMGKRGAITGATLSLDSGVDYAGDLILVSVEYKADVDGQKIPFALNFQFSGRITGDGVGSGSADDSGDSGTIYTDLKEVTSTGAMSYTRDYIDQRGTRAVEPFLVVGIAEDAGVPLSLAVERVVDSLGGFSHSWRGDSTLPFSRVANAQWLGVGLIGGMLVYDRNATDCRAYQYRSELGFLVRGKELQYITGDSGSDSDDVCTAIATGSFSARLARWMDSTQAYVIHLIPCIWDDMPPDADEDLVAMINKINTNAITIEGVSRAAFTLWFRGVDGVRAFTGADGTKKYFGYLSIGELKDGWTDGKLICAQSVPFDVAGQSAPGYTVRASVRQLYKYERVTWQTIAQLCPACYGA